MYIYIYTNIYIYIYIYIHIYVYIYVYIHIRIYTHTGVGRLLSCCSAGWEAHACALHGGFIYICIYIYIYICIYIYIHVHIYAHTGVGRLLRRRMGGTRLRSAWRLCIYLYIYTYTYVYVHIYIYVYTHTQALVDCCGAGWEGHSCALHGGYRLALSTQHGLLLAHTWYSETPSGVDGGGFYGEWILCPCKIWHTDNNSPPSVLFLARIWYLETPLEVAKQQSVQVMGSVSSVRLRKETGGCRFVAREWVMSHVWMKHATYVIESRHTHELVTSQMWMSHVTHMNEACHSYEWVVSHIWMRYVTRMNGSHRWGAVWDRDGERDVALG